MHLRHARYLTFTLAGATVVSNGVYLFYLMQHHMVRLWSGVNGVLLGLFMLSWSATLAARGGYWSALAISLIGAFNIAVGFLFFL